LTDEFVKCRTVGHTWDEIPDDGLGQQLFKGSKSTQMVVFRCTTCTMRRYEVWSLVTGDLVDRRYFTPEGYRLAKGSGANRRVMRKEYIDRTRGVTWSAQRKKAS
jgi:hypothetical protein